MNIRKLSALPLCIIAGCYANLDLHAYSEAGSASTSDPNTSTAPPTSASTTDPGTTSPTASTTSTTSDATTTIGVESATTSGGCPMLYPDFDHDGYGDMGSDRVPVCGDMGGYSENQSDCDDGNSHVNPDAVEKCEVLPNAPDDPDDEDCDGLIDEWSAENMYCNGCHLAVDMSSGHSYWFCELPILLPWNLARMACESLNADLAVISTGIEHKFVVGQLASLANLDELWLGGYDTNPEISLIPLDKSKMEYRWVDGSAITTQPFQAWSGTNPDYDNGCVLHKVSDETWRDRACDEPHGFICESSN